MVLVLSAILPRALWLGETKVSLGVLVVSAIITAALARVGLKGSWMRRAGKVVGSILVLVVLLGPLAVELSVLFFFLLVFCRIIIWPLFSPYYGALKSRLEPTLRKHLY
jgi:hypothetical protein